MLVDFEPIRPVQTFQYRCDSRFHTSALKSMLTEMGENSYGFIVVDGNGALFGLLQGSHREVLQKFSVELPNKHRRGGQSALRFERLCTEKRNLYIQKVAGRAVSLFIADNRSTVAGLVVAGAAGCKDDLLKSTSFKPLLSLLLKTIDISYGGERGFDQAIEESVETIGSVKLLQEKRVLEQYFEEVQRDAGKYCFSIEDTMQALDVGAVDTLLVWEDLGVSRYEMQNRETGDTMVRHLSKEQEEAECSGSGNSMFNITKEETLLEWIYQNHHRFGCNLELVSDRTGAGQQFVQGFGGIGGILRWKIDYMYDQDADEQAQGRDSSNDDASSGNCNAYEYNFDGAFGF